MKDLKQLNFHPLNVQARRILKTAKIPTYSDQMPISTLMLWVMEEKGIDPLPEWAALENFQDRYADLEEAVRDLDQRNPVLLLDLVEQGEDEEETAIQAKDLLNLEPEDAAVMLLEELRSGMEFHPEKYQDRGQRGRKRMSEKEIEKTLQMIVTELAEMKGQLADIQRQLAYLANPMATVSLDERTKVIKAAIATGDRRVLRATLKKINGR